MEGVLTTIGLGGIVGSGVSSANAAGKAADAQAAAAERAAALSKEQFDITRGDLAPYRDAGARGLDYYQNFLGMNGADSRGQAYDQFRSSPGYQFAMDEGVRATEGGAAARGGLLSGGTLKALQDRGMGLADQTQGSYLDRFLGLSSLGQNAAAQTGNFGAQAARDQGNYFLDAGAARAGGYLGKADAFSGVINNSLKLAGRASGGGYF